MFGILVALSAFACLVVRLVAWPGLVFLYDAKGLRKYPKLHWLSGVTNIPFMVESRRGFRSQRLLQLHHHQGHPVIRIGPNSLSYGGVDAIASIYGHSTQTTKDRQYIEASGSHYHLADVVDKKEHARKRKVLSAAFAAKNLEGWEYKIAANVARLQHQFDRHIQQHPGDPIDYRLWTNLFTFENLCDLCVSERPGCLDRGDDMVLAEDLAGHQELVSFRDCLYATFHVVGDLVWAYEWYPFLVRLSGWLSPFYSRLFRLASGWGNIIQHLSRKRWERYERGEKIDDIFAALMDDPSGEPHNLEWGEVMAEISLAISGSSSTSNSIASTMILLVEHPRVMQRLQEEVDAVLSLGPNDMVASYDSVKYLPYLRAVLDESLRLFPPISHGLPRETPSEGMAIRDEWVAGGTTVSISAFVAHRDPAVFPDPEAFVPERWLDEAGKGLQTSFIAFSAGARGCIGRPISYLQATVLLASLVHRYDFEKVQDNWQPQRRETMNLILGQVPLHIRRRSIH
ncbi:cytochrome p450 [Penicillium macrosclerotiorum]|uniref:cytochrome p450 n=1 Tax=Penicillium macrosclerotiorum TaxID=303699 RepID=UPI00254776AF|nr:cytochrome p450 [Penicillium macrosclerotiorum]KAJ5688655.1 cytochrome p450 [Penicillium macrosclerotiorum]